jgi:RND superfamily putative drug exporter
VFGGFVLGSDPFVKMMGLGLATAIFVDATIVRIILVPATMKLMGDTNWWIPNWLDRLIPQIDIEGDSALPPAEYESDADDTPTPREPALV